MTAIAALLAVVSTVLCAQDIEALRQAAILHPDEVKAHLALGNAYLNSEPPDTRLARTEFNRVLELDENNIEAHYSLGMIARAEWQAPWLAARKESQMSLMDPGPLPVSARQALKAEYSSILEDGISHFTRVLQLDPDHDRAKEGLALLILGRADLRDTKEEYESDVATARRLNSQLRANLRPPQTTPAAPPSPDGRPTRIRVGGNVQAANLIKKVVPVYPHEAKKAHVSGQVRFTVIIATDGTIKSIVLVSGDPMLVDAARDAVQQWVYKPTKFNGYPVEVVTVIDVNFNLR